MPERRTAVFLINLVQDVNILRPLVFMASRDFGMECLLLASEQFVGRDQLGIWYGELEEIAAETGARLHFFANDWEARQQLTGRGVIFAASESHLHNHVTTHSVFRHAPPGYVRVTLQHGFECVGFRHSADHVRAHGPTASFGADYVCAWADPSRLYSLAPSQAAKIIVTGPTAVLQSPTGPIPARPGKPGLVCENLHSVRLNAAGDFKGQFVAAFSEFCDRMARIDRKVALRPHPGGQYVVKNKVPLPPNAVMENAPMYRTDLRSFAYGISAPSSVLLDMLIAGIPTAVWRDRGGKMDADAYAGLTEVSGPEEWFDFAASAAADPGQFAQRQADFLDAQGLILDPEEVYARFAALFQMVLRAGLRPIGAVAETDRILFVANARVPTLQLSFEKPLAPLVERGEIATELLTELEVSIPAATGGEEAQQDWLDAYLDRFSPSVIIFCRYSGPGTRQMIGWARARGVPVIYHIDDDLLAIPPDIGEKKHAFHNSPERIEVVRETLAAADLVYASTARLKETLLEHIPGLNIVAGEIYCSGALIKPPRKAPTRKIGYMASADHAHNLTIVLPALERLLDANPGLHLEFFGSIPRPPQLERFSDRIRTAPPIADYESFLTRFAEYRWDIGICPLAPIDFNLMKANTKWVEYSSVGAAVVASRGTIYDESCAGGCGLLAGTAEEWFDALSLLVNDDQARVAMVDRAQRKVEQDYNIGRLREQVLAIVAAARDIVAQGRR
ncbi:hypothetical protein H8M03_05595 [Sphingomonas sabuli]|uniref:Glycosyltransferase n=1 Tax=Sphingomonas sabuli TaxID=2764186 RepID=A0A7G9L595_9SPHN|nr:hypothetical protein [Sphingomonas sabuli]QNM83794.1 hypothetical protein H8M03_05595 [Sphingomonas sabuli]